MDKGEDNTHAPYIGSRPGWGALKHCTVLPRPTPAIVLQAYGWPKRGTTAVPLLLPKGASGDQ